MTKTLILSQKQAEKHNYSDGNTYAIISITNLFERKARLFGTGIKGVLRLSFDDVDKKGTMWTTKGYADIYGMSEADAKSIVDFVELTWGKVDYLVVHCEMGISRSSGVVAAIEKYKNGSDMEIFENKEYVPNMTCYRLVLNEFYNRESLAE